MATYIVGDIQGCYDALQRLLEKIRFDPAADRLWTPGDLVNRGRQSLETLRVLKGLGGSFAMTLGNHDLYLLREHWRFPDGGSANREMDVILHAPDREQLIDWLRRQPSLFLLFPCTGSSLRRSGKIRSNCRLMINMISIPMHS